MFWELFFLAFSIVDFDVTQEEEALKGLLISEFSGEGSLVGLSILKNPVVHCSK